MMGWIIFGSFFLLMLIGVPIGLAIGLASLIVFLASGFPLQMVPQTLLEGNNSFALVAVPFFILAGDLLAKGGISERIVSSNSSRSRGRGRARQSSRRASPMRSSLPSTLRRLASVGCAVRTSST